MATFTLVPPPQLLPTCSHEFWADLLFPVRESNLCPAKTSKKQLFIANETADSLDDISNLHFISSTMLNES